MDTLGERLRNLREKILNDIPRETFVKGLGVSAKTLERYEGNERTPNANFFTNLWAKYHDKIDFADITLLLYGQKVDYLKTVSTPVLGRVPGGFPKDIAAEDIVEYINMPDAPKDAFALVVDGDSMGPDIKDGDYVIFLPAERADISPGDTVIANDEFNRPMVKRYVIKDGKPYLKSDNPGYPSFEANENYSIVGKVIDVWSRKKIRRAP